MHRLLRGWRVLAVGCEGIRNVNSFVEDANSNDKYRNIHIAAYENNIKDFDYCNSLNKSKTTNAKIMFTTCSVIQDSFEFCRQQEDVVSEPQIAQFKSSQKLIDPNEKISEPNISPDDFFNAAVSRLGKQKVFTTTSSRKKEASQSPSVPPEKKPKFDIRFHKKSISNLLPDTATVNPYQIENVKLKSDLKDKDALIEQLQKQLKEANSKNRNNEKHLTSSYQERGDRRQRQIINEEFDYFNTKFGDSASEVVSKLYNRYDNNETSLFTAAETGHIFQASGINLNKARKLRREIYTHSPNGVQSIFASQRKLDEQKKMVRAGIEFEDLYVKLKSKAGVPLQTKLVTFMSNPAEYYQRRMQRIMDNKLYRKIIFEGREELWCSLTIDKASTRTILGMSIGNTLKAVNSAYNFSFLGIYEADDSLYNINEAFDKIFKILGKIKDLTLRTPDGDTVTLPVRWFYVADYKSQRAVAGIQGGNPKYPSVNCLSQMKEKYGEIDLTKKCPPRPKGVYGEYSQEKPSLAPFIPPSHFIPPPLHMTLGPGLQLFDYLFEMVAKLDAEKSNTNEIYQQLTANPNWKKELRKAYLEITDMHTELQEMYEVEMLYTVLLSSSTKNDRKLQPCTLQDACVVKLLGKNIPSFFVSSCDKCSKLVHRCCKSADLSCPHCNPFKPTINSGRVHLVEETNLINERTGELVITLAEKELKFRSEAQKLQAGVLTKILEKVLEKHGGSRKAFFQSYSGTHLIKMGNNLDKIIQDLPPEIKDEERIQIIFNAIKLFFDAKRSMKKDLNMSEDDINIMKQKIMAFGTYMKQNLGSLKPKQKGHLFLFEAPEFASRFKTVSFFSDEAVESCHPLHNDQEKRIKCKESPKKYSLLLKWSIDNNYYFDSVDCKSYEEK